jgi:hypothetical protein
MTLSTRGGDVHGAAVGGVPKIKQMLKPLREHAINIERLRLAEDLEARFLNRLMSGASVEELGRLIAGLKDISAKIDPNATSVLMTATTRKRARLQTS